MNLNRDRVLTHLDMVNDSSLTSAELSILLNLGYCGLGPCKYRSHCQGFTTYLRASRRNFKPVTHSLLAGLLALCTLLSRPGSLPPRPQSAWLGSKALTPSRWTQPLPSIPFMQAEVAQKHSTNAENGVVKVISTQM